MKWLTNRVILIIVLLFALGFFYTNFMSVSVKLTSSGFVPIYTTILKGQSVTFSSDINKTFWPASDPHPNHTNFSAFDPKKGIAHGEIWKFKFDNSGTFQYHDHLDPRFRGVITVLETNPLGYFANNLAKIYKSKFIKLDENYAKDKIDLCSKKPGRVYYMECWSNVFSELVRDWGAGDAMRVLSVVSKNARMTIGDCHLIADQIGTDAYWNYISGKKFDEEVDFSLCDYGFFHHFMSEHVSHGQNFKGSEEFCKSLGEGLVAQCYLGMGNGLSYYFWNLFPTDADKIVKNSLEVCEKLTQNKDECVFGVYSGIDHIYEGQHGSELIINLSDPFSFCRKQKNVIYQKSCYERMVPSMAYALNKDVSESVTYLVGKILKMPLHAQKEALRRLGIMLSEEEAVKENSDIKKPIAICRRFFNKIRSECEWGVFYNIFENSKLPSDKFYNIDCESFGVLNKLELENCTNAGISAFGKPINE